MKAWPMGSDDDSASGSSKSSPSNSPYPSGRKTLTTARSLDELNEESYNGGGKTIEIFIFSCWFVVSQNYELFIKVLLCNVLHWTETSRYIQLVVKLYFLFDISNFCEP